MSANGPASERDFAPDAPPPPAPQPNSPGARIAGTLLEQSTGKVKRTKRRYTVRKNKPKRPLSAYNLFFRYERERMVRETLAENGDDDNVESKVKSGGRITSGGKRAHRKTHGAIGFAELGRRIAAAWKGMDEEARAPFQAEADKDKERYRRELSALPPVPPTLPNAHHEQMIREEQPRGAPMHHGRDFGDGGAMDGPHPYPGYNAHPQYGSPPGHNPQPYYDQRGYWGNSQMQAPSAFAPPHPHGSPGYAPPRYPPRSPYDRNDGNPQMQMAPAFAPPMPTHHYQRSPHQPNYSFPSNQDGGNRLLDDEEDPDEPMEYAFQCEVCGKAVFETFEECSEHEKHCKGGTAEADGALQKKKSDEEEAHERAVEAVMLLKKPIEC